MHTAEIFRTNVRVDCWTKRTRISIFLHFSYKPSTAIKMDHQVPILRQILRETIPLLNCSIIIIDINCNILCHHRMLFGICMSSSVVQYETRPPQIVRVHFKANTVFSKQFNEWRIQNYRRLLPTWDAAKIDGWTHSLPSFSDLLWSQFATCLSRNLKVICFHVI